jgi:hypothetical protein
VSRCLAAAPSCDLIQLPCSLMQRLHLAVKGRRRSSRPPLLPTPTAEPTPFAATHSRCLSPRSSSHLHNTPKQCPAAGFGCTNVQAARGGMQYLRASCVVFAVLTHLHLPCRPSKHIHSGHHPPPTSRPTLRHQPRSPTSLLMR